MNSPTGLIQDVFIVQGDKATYIKEDGLERLYEGRRANVKRICSKYGVLLNDGWSFINDEFIEELVKA